MDEPFFIWNCGSDGNGIVTSEMNQPELLIATYNRGKLEELHELLAGLEFELRDLHLFPAIKAVAETGNTFAENAQLKAKGYARQTGLMTLADDSGLEVSVLGGLPGVRSARYAGEGASDAERVDKLLFELARATRSDRSARFVSIIVISDATGAVLHEATGICAGEIAHAPRGENGFGYDPVFIPAGFGQTFAELSSDVKNQISHRGRALKKTAEFLRSLTADSGAG
jgi:XTP/dITP diphosphohydrolase